MSAKQELTIGLMYPSEYLLVDDLKGRNVTVVIFSVKQDVVVLEGGVKEIKPLLTMANPKTGEAIAKKFIANKTNAHCMSLLLGPVAKDWEGKRITFTPDMDIFGKEPTPCIRILGSPDASPERAAAYAKAWLGVRQRGALVRRVKKAEKRMLKIVAPPVDSTPPETPDDAGSLPVANAQDAALAALVDESEGASND